MTKPIKRFRSSTRVKLAPGDLILVWDGWNQSHTKPRNYLIFKHEKLDKMNYLNLNTMMSYPGSNKVDLSPTIIFLKEEVVVVSLNPSQLVSDYLVALGL